MHSNQVDVVKTVVLLTAATCIYACAEESQGSTREQQAIAPVTAQLALCFTDEECLAGLVCYGPGLGEPAGDAGYCTQGCMADADCEPMEGMAATCAPGGQCRVDCTGSGQGDGPCPSGTVCRDADPREEELAYRCMFPEGTGAGFEPEWAQCNPEHGDADCADGRTCTDSASGSDRLGYCATPCEGDDSSGCIAPAGVTAVPLCASFYSICSLDCSAAGSTCPPGMQCVDAGWGDQVAMRCRYLAADTMEE